MLFEDDLLWSKYTRTFDQRNNYFLFQTLPVRILLNLFAVVLVVSCAPSADSNSVTKEENPSAEGFNMENSDEEAIVLADQVMKAMGGRQAYDNTSCIQWTFFGRRTLTWDRINHRCRIDIPSDSTSIMINLEDDSGWAMVADESISHPDSLAQLMDQGRRIWINDSYWLVMPFKLKDSGVTLKYGGPASTLDGRSSKQLELTFENVGVTPQNKYLVYVDDSSGLVSQWDFYTNATDTVPRFSTPWSDYEAHGDILLSGNRGRGSLTDIQVMTEIDEGLFADPAGE